MSPHNHPPQNQAHYISPPQQLPLHPLLPEQYSYNMYDQDGRNPLTLYGAEYTIVSSARTKRTQRTSQACEACRHAKARCTDSKPCQGCVQKGINCIYDPPPPKQTDSDILGRLKDKIDNLLKRQKSLEKALITPHPKISTIREQSDKVIRGWRRKYEEEDLDSCVREVVKAYSDDGSETHVTEMVPSGEPAVLIGRPSGAAEIPQWPAVMAMVGDKMEKDGYRGIDPPRHKIQRGVMNLYGLSEGVHRSVGYEKDSISDDSLDPSISDSETYSKTAYSSSLKQQFSLSGGQRAVAESYFFMADSDARAAVDLTTLPQLEEQTVRHVSQSYMRHLNVMHPIITQKSLDEMITNFMQQVFHLH